MIVLDASVAVDMVRGTSDGMAYRELMLDGEKVVAPHLFVSEVADALLKHVRAGCFDAGTAAAMALEAYEIVDEFVPDENLMPEVLHEAAYNGHSSYDTFYLVLARRNKATLFTRDKKLTALCESCNIDCVHAVRLERV